MERTTPNIYPDIDGLPATVADALELFLANVYDWEQFEGVSEKDFGRIGLVKRIIDICDLPSNVELRASCGSEDMTAQEASQIIVRKMWTNCILYNR